MRLKNEARGSSWRLQVPVYWAQPTAFYKGHGLRAGRSGMGGGGRAALVVDSIKSYKSLNVFGFPIPNNI
jgi:hypothetical protein